MANLSPVYVDAQLILGVPAVGAKIFTYAAGSTTPLATYTDSSGVTPQTNPIILDARGEPPSPIWLTDGRAYKFVFTASTDTDPPTSPIRTIDNVTGVGDNSIQLSQWQDSSVTPIYVSPDTFTADGDQTSLFQVNRRIKALVTSGTVYGRISASSYNGILTTVTVVLDSGALDNGISSVQLGLITSIDTSLPNLPDNIWRVYGSADPTKQVALEVDALTTATTRTLTVRDRNITIASVDEINGGVQVGSKIQPVSASVALNALTVGLDPTTLDFRSPTITTGTSNTVSIASALSLVVPSGATLGTINATKTRLIILVAYNSGAPVLCIANVAGGLMLDETNLINTTVISGASNSNSIIYSASAVSANSPYRVVGYIDITEATAGTWATAPSIVQGFGGEATNFDALYKRTYTAFTVGVQRVSATPYYNDKPYDIEVLIGTNANVTLAINVGGITIHNNTVQATPATFTVPKFTSYTVTSSSLLSWAELL